MTRLLIYLLSNRLGNMKENPGFIGILTLGVGVLALLFYFLDWSIFDVVESDKGRATVIYVRDVLAIVWTFILDSAGVLWRKVVELKAS